MTERISEVVRHRGLLAEMRDGTVLCADAWVPSGTERWPVLLQRLPYGRSVASAPVLPHPEQLARRGYAVVVQDVRGRGGSGGVFSPFVHEGPDGYDTIEWAARLPFSDGRVATYGFSYQGLNQLAAAALRPPSLRAIAPLMTATEPYEGWTYEGGCLRWPFVAAWAAQLAAQEEGASARTPDLDALPAAGALGDDPPRWFREWLEHPTDDDYWQERRPDLDAIEVPVFTVLGYFDDFAAGTACLLGRLEAEGVCGPWAHMPWGTRAGAVELGAAADPTIAHAALIAFFDRVLKGRLDPAPRISYFAGAAGWRSAQSWPPRDRVATWVATSGGNANSRHGDGRLAPASPGAGPARLGDLLVSEPLVPYPGFPAPLSDEAPAEDRRDVLCYTSDPLAGAMVLAGSPRARLVVCADVPSFDVVVSLVAVGARGATRRLCTGARRAAGQTDREMELLIELGPVGWSLAAGEQLRVDVSASRFPTYDRNPQSGLGTAAAAGREACVVATIHLRELVVELPTVSDLSPAEGSPASGLGALPPTRKGDEPK